MKSSLLLLLSLLFGTCLLRASRFDVHAPFHPGVVTFQAEVDVVNGFVPIELVPYRAVVRHGTQVTLVLPTHRAVALPNGDTEANLGPESLPKPRSSEDVAFSPKIRYSELVWSRVDPMTGQSVVVGRGPTLTFKASSASRAWYSVTAGLPWPLGVRPIRLEVYEAGHVANLSTLQRLAGTEKGIVGYTIAGSQPKRVLIRAVGPSLELFGVAGVVKKPRFQIYDASGRVVDRGFRIAALLPDSSYQADFVRAGAFPLRTPLANFEPPLQAFDVLVLDPGAYTIHGWDVEGKGGTLLIEVYEMPEAPAP